MRLSRYSLRVNLEDGTYLLYNTYSGSLAQIDSESHAIIEKSLQHQLLNEDEEDLIRELEESKILCTDDTDEDYEIREWYQAKRRDTGRMHITVLTTNACNMACDYCFEGEALKGTHMDQRTMQALIVWAEQKISELKPQTLSIRFFGGEPFVNPKGLLHLAREFRRLADEAGVELYLLATTNGTLLSRPLIEELAQLGLKELRVTIDGDEELHNKKRPLKNKQNSFQTIWKNLESVRDLVSLNIAINADPGDEGSLIQILPKLKESSFSEAIRQVNIKPVIRHNEALGVSDMRVTKEVAENVSEWRALISNTGIKAPSQLEGGPCQIHYSSNFIVDPKGDLYPCESSIGQTSSVVGSIFLEKLPTVEMKGKRFFKEYSPLDHPKCATCSYFPICGGGCRLASFTMDPDEKLNVHCPIELHEATVPKAIIDQFLLAKQAKEREEVTE